MRCCCIFNKDNNNLTLNKLSEPLYTFSEIKQEFNENKGISKLSTKKTFPFKLTKINDKNSTYKSIRQINQNSNLNIGNKNSSNISKNKIEINHSIVENLKFSYYNDNEDKLNDRNISNQKNSINITNINTLSSKKKEQNLISTKNVEENFKNLDSSSFFSEQENEIILSLTNNNNKIYFNNTNNNSNNNNEKNKSNKNLETNNSNQNNSNKRMIQFKKSENFEKINKNNDGKKFSSGNIKKFNVFSNRRSSLMIYGKNENEKKSLKRNSIMQLYEKKTGLNEFKMIETLSKNHNFLSRIKLIENTYLKNKRLNLIESCHLNKEGKGKMNLYLENIVGKLLLEKLIITPLGLLENNRRNQKDTLTFFGYSEQKNFNDYVLNNTSFIYNNKTFSKTLFAISYDINNEKYFIQPILDKEKQGRLIYIGIPNFVYIFINTKFFLLNKNLIQIIPSSNNKIYNLQIKVYDNNTGKCNEFNVNNISKDKTISIGYSINNYISLKGNRGDEDECILNFDKEKEIWSIKGKKLWSVLDQKISINNYIYIKIGEDIIKVTPSIN